MERLIRIVTFISLNLSIFTMSNLSLTQIDSHEENYLSDFRSFNGINITCKGNPDVVCAEGTFPDGSSWTAFGDEVEIIIN